MARVERLSTLEKDLTRILVNNWQPGSARMIFVHHTAAWAGKYSSWTQWVKHLTEVTENKEQWLFRVFKSGQLLLEVAEKYFNTVPDYTSVESIERVLLSFEKALVETVYLGGLLTNKTGDPRYVHDAALGKILQPELRALLKNPPTTTAGDSSESEEGEAEESESSGRASAAAEVRTGVVSLAELRKACEELEIDPTAGYALLKRLGVVIRKDP